MLRHGEARLMVGLLTMLAASGCAGILGLDEFEDAPVGGAGSGGLGGDGAGAVGGNGGTGGVATQCTPDDTQSCYSGPAGTEDVGLCVAGTETCDADGAWGDCEGETVPATEDCSIFGDEDCDGSGCSDVLWANAYGEAPGFAFIAGAASTADGGIVLAGAFAGELDFGPAGSFSANDDDAYMVKLNGDGVPVWAEHIGPSAGLQFAGPVANAASGALAVVVSTSEAGIDFGTGFTAGQYFVAVYEEDGTFRWAKSIQATASIDLRSVTWTPTGDVLVGGSFVGDLSFGGSNYSTTLVSGLLVRLNGTTGAESDSIVFEHEPTNPGDVFLVSADTSATGEIYAAINFSGSLNLGFGMSPVAIAGQGADAAVVKLSPSFAGEWVTVYEGNTDKRIFSLDVAADGRAAVTTRISGNVVINTPGFSFPAQTTGATDENGMVTVITSAGAHAWSVQFGESDDQFALESTGLGATFDSEGGIVVAAGLTGDIDLGGTIFPGANDADWIIAAYEASGTFRWGKRVGSPSVAQTAFAPVSGSDSVYAIGINDGVLNFGPTVSVDSTGTIQGVVAKFSR